MIITPQEEIDLHSVVSSLKEGKTIVYPTETCYGLGCDATNQAAVDQIFSIKQRQQEKSVLVIMSDPDMAMEYVVWNEVIDQLATNYWPGPLTVVAQARPESGLAQGVVADDGTVAFRITDHHFAHELVEELAVPIVSTSANISTHASPYRIKEVLDMFESASNRPDIVIDGGELQHKSPSTIVKVTDGELVVLRQGELVVDQDLLV